MNFLPTGRWGETTPNTIGRNCLRGGRSNLVDFAGWPEIGLLNWGLGSILLVSPRKKKQQNIEFTKFSSVPRKSTKSNFQDWPRSSEF